MPPDPNSDQPRNPWQELADEEVPEDVGQRLSQFVETTINQIAVDADHANNSSRIGYTTNRLSEQKPWVATLVAIAATLLVAVLASFPISLETAQTDMVTGESPSNDSTGGIRSNDSRSVHHDSNMEVLTGPGQARFVAMTTTPNSTVLQSSIQNGSFEELKNGFPTPWFFAPLRKEYSFNVATDGALHGTHCIKVTAESVSEPNAFANVMQSVSAELFRGKRIRYRAALRVEGKSPVTQAQLWLRADTKPINGGVPSVVLFDNMDNRPVQSSKWKYYDIVGDVPSEAESIFLGAFLIGEGTMWFDDCTLEIVDPETATTAESTPSISSGGGISRSPDRPIEPIGIVVRSLLCVGVALVLMMAAQVSRGILGRFALPFTLTYWLLYSKATCIPVVGYQINEWIDPLERWIVQGVARTFLGFDRALTLPNGSGDTTFDYLRVWLIFLVAIIIALLWFLASLWLFPNRPKTDDDSRSVDAMASPISRTTMRVRDVLNIYVRYSLASILLGYGLAKLSPTMNQFPSPGIDQLMKTYGESSPMNLLWTFMGASRPYTYLAGLAEVLPALLLLSRRTAFLGAAIALAVMLNVFLLNMCYDVPVKQFSFHLVVMALFLMAPEIPRLFRLLILNQAVEKRDIGPSYGQVWSYFIHYGIKYLVIIAGFLFPVMVSLTQSSNSFDPFRQPEGFGHYRVQELEMDGQIVSKELPETWTRVALTQYPSFEAGAKPQQILTIHASRGSATFNIEFDPANWVIKSPDANGELKLSVDEPGNYQLSGVWQGKPAKATLKRIEREDFLLMNRGFRWINEQPYNR